MIYSLRGWTAQRSTMNVRLSLKSSSLRKKRSRAGGEGGGNSGRLVHRGRGPCHLAMRRTMSGELSSNDTTARWMEHRSNGWWAVDSIYAHANIPYTTSVMFTFDGSLIWSAQVNVRRGFAVSPCCFSCGFKPTCSIECQQNYSIEFLQRPRPRHVTCSILGKTNLWRFCL